MRKGIVIFSVVNFLLAAVMALLGLSYGQPVQSCYLMYSLSLAGGSLVLFGLNKRIHKTSIISSYIAALLSALWALLSLGPVNTNSDKICAYGNHKIAV